MSDIKTLFQDQRPDIHRLSDIYDPDTNTDGTIIPSVDSILIDTDNNGNAYYVTYVDATTHKVTYKPLSIVYTNEGDDETSIVDYGNNRFKVFYDDRVEPTRLNIDSLLLIFGTNNTEYKLLRTDPITNESQVVSTYYDSDGTYKGDRAPLRTVEGYTGAKYATNCHTLLTLSDNELITMEVYDRTGVLSATISLFAQRAKILNDLSSKPIIVDFRLDSPQINTNGDLYLYEKQDISALVLTPTIVYNTGREEIIPVDNETCFLYGTDDLVASYPGLKQTILCKYFLRTEEVAEGAVDDAYGRYLVVEKDLVILSNNAIFGSKISIIPKWKASISGYELRFFMYTTERDNVYDVTNYVTMISSYNPSNFDTTQVLEYEVDLQDFLDIDQSSVYRQHTWLRLKPYGNTIERYIIKDSANDAYAYGVESSVYRRPVVHYDTTLQQYFIPTSVFLNKEALIEAAYTRARPLVDTQNELSAPMPTHITFRDIDTSNTIVSAPIPIEEYNQAWNAIIIGESINKYVNGTIILEFLRELNGTYQIIYGVPVDVHASETGYQG